MKKIVTLSCFLFALNSFLTGQMIPTPEHFIQLDGENFHYTDYGKGSEVILCLHGFALSSLSYIHARPYFDETKYRLLAIDLKGNGFSDKPRDSDYTLEKQSKIIEKFLSKMDVKRVNLIGHSYGGMVCLYLNYKQSEKSLNFSIVTTTLIDTPAYNKNIPFLIKVLKNKIGAQLVLATAPLGIRSRIAINGGFYNYRKGRDEYLEVYKTLLGQKEYANSLHQIAQQVIPNNFKEISDSYRSFDVPFLILWGSNDNFINRSHAETLIKDIKNSELVIIEKTSHNPHEEKPEEVFGLIKQFIIEN